MMINSVNSFSTRPNFKGRPSKAAKLAIEQAELAKLLAQEEMSKGLSNNTKKLVLKTSELIENTWARIKHKKIKMTQPVFELKNKKGNMKITVKPLYNSHNGDILFEIDKLAETERIIFDRRANSYKYEKLRKTPHGYLTAKTFDSKIQESESNIDNKIDNYITEFVPEILKQYTPKFKI